MGGGESEVWLWIGIFTLGRKGVSVSVRGTNAGIPVGGVGSYMVQQEVACDVEGVGGKYGK